MLKTILLLILNQLKKWYIITSIVLIFAVVIIYTLYFSATRIAFANFSDFQFAKFSKVAENQFIEVDRITMKTGHDAPDLDGYDTIYIFGMGLHLNREMKEKITDAIDDGAYVYVHMATNKENDLTNIAGKDLDMIQDYLKYGGFRNYSALLNYTRRVLDAKTFFTDDISEPFEIPKDYLFYPGVEEFYHSVEEYEKFCGERSLFHKGARRAAIFISNVTPQNSSQEHMLALFDELQKYNIDVYPVAGFKKRMEYLREIKPDVVIYIPHGKFSFGRGKEVTDWLAKNRVPLISPLFIFQPKEKWEQSQQGIFGGMLTQSIVMPEIDGGIQPYVIAAQERNDEGLYVFKPISKRVRSFAGMVNMWLNLQSKSNSDKKVAIFYYKGPGLNAMVAAGMEVAPSLLELLKHLKREGYNTRIDRYSH